MGMYVCFMYIQAGAAASATAYASVASCSDDHIPAPTYGWPHDGAMSSFDHAA